MKTMKAVFAVLIVLAGAFAADSALAWGRGGHARVGVGFYFGVPVGGWGYYYPPPYYYYPPYYPYYPQTIVVPAQPQVYVEQGAQASAPAQGYWYYCPDSRAYYPYVKDCPGGWQRVAPQPAQ